MTIRLMGVDFRRAPLALREALAFDRDAALAFLPALVEETGVREAALLSTCNRTELYVVDDGGEAGPDPALAVMRSKGIEPDGGVWTRRSGDEAVEHLFSVAAGLESMVKGEAQILGQVKEAFRTAVDAMTTGPVLNRLFHAAFRAGKRVRSETGISEGAVSVSQAAVELAARDCGGSLEGLDVAVVGAGEMAGLVVRHLASRKAGRVTVVNRTRGRAEALAGPIGARAEGLDALGRVLACADVVLSACSADGYLVTPAIVGRRTRPLYAVDIGIPRTVDPAVAREPGCTLKNIDALNGFVDGNLRRREAEALRGAAIVREEVGEAMRWIATRRNAPLIQSLAEYMEHIRARELRRVCRDETLSEEDKLERLSTHIIRKITQPIIKKLNEARADGDEAALETTLKLLQEVYRI